MAFFRLFDKFQVLAITALIMPTVRFIGAATAALLGAGFEGFVMAWFIGSLCAYVFLISNAALELARRRLLKRSLTAQIKFFSPRKGLWPFVIKSNVDSTLAAANVHLPMLLVTSVFGPVWAGIFKIAEEVAKLLSEGFKLLDQVIYPELAKMVSAGHVDKIWRLVSRAALILLMFGISLSIAFLFVGPYVLKFLTSNDFMPAVPLASLLVPAAALLGAAAPLYPIFYAADRPMRAVYARGLGVLVYILTFFGLSATIGRMAPGWAAIAGNATAVLFVIFFAKRTLRKASQITQTLNEKEASMSTETSSILSPKPKVSFLEQTQARIWGLPLGEWQARAFKKVGAELSGADSATLFVDQRRVMSSSLMTALVETPGTALVEDGIVIAVHNSSHSDTHTGTVDGFIGKAPDKKALEAAGLTVQTPKDLAGSYNKALRKTDVPYALDTEAVSMVDIMRRQFQSSYKGITDFVTKWIWPWPAFYVTRLCAHLRLTPNMVTTIGFVLMFIALYAFWQGQWALGFVTGWMMTFLDTVDGKLARTTMTYSAWGNVYDHGIDLIHPPFWYVAWFVGLGGQFQTQGLLSDPLGADMMSLAIVAICVGYVVDRIVEGIFIAWHGFHIHVWTRLNSALRFVIARRNPNMFIFMIGIMASIIWPDAGRWGFYAVAIWVWVCIGLNSLALLISGVVRKPLTSWMEG